MVNLKNIYEKTEAIDAYKIAKECGNIKSVNIVLLGLLARSTKIDKVVWLVAMKEVIPGKLLGNNIKAFEAGYSPVDS